MKKKFFSKLLMVALVATVGAFSSCKDYDDDIADVRNTINQTAKDLQTEYTNKISEVSSKVDKLQTSYDALSAALTEANTKLTALINSRFSEAVETAKAYSDANLVKAKDAAAAAESAAKAYADIQRVEAEKAALAAAQKEVAAAKAELQEALNKATETIATQGKSIEGLTKTCADLDAAVKAAQARANEAYALADKANTLAEQNKTALEKAASDIAALQTALANLDGKVADKAEVAKIQSELNALKDQVDKNVVSLSDYNTAITKLTSDLGALKDDLAKQVGVLGESIAAVKLVADGNVAKIDGITTELSTLKEANTQAHEQIIASINSLAQTVESNKSAAADALKAAIDGVMAELGAAKTLIENNDAAIRTLVDTKASELKALIDGNTAAIVKNAQDIQKNAETQKAENTLMNNAIAKNAQDIVAQGKDITKLDDAVKALKVALGDDTAATLKAYAESIAKSEALQAKLDAQGYSDAQDAAQNITIMEAIKQQAAQDAAAWKSAIDLAIENLVTTYKLASLNEYIKQTAEAAQTTAEQNAAVKAQQIADKALQDAKAYTDVLAQTLKDNYTTTTDMQTAIENAKKAAISQAYLDVLNTLLRDYDAWYSMNNENKMNLELTPTIIELTKAAVEKYGLTKENAQSIIDATIEAGLTKPEGTGTYDKDGNEIMTEPGVIMAEILAAADALQQEFTEKFNGLDLRLQPIEEFLGATLGEGEAFKASVNAIIATSATASDVEALKKQIAGTEASGLLTKINDAAAQAAQNAADVQKVMTTINNINGMFSSLFGGAEATSNVDQNVLNTFEENIQSLIDRISDLGKATDDLKEQLPNEINKYLSATVNTMITSVNLFANQHMAIDDDPDALGFDHDLNFIYVIEEDNVFPRADFDATGIDFSQQKYVNGNVEFKKGTLRTYGDKILVRVSPVNATFTKEQVALINSQKEDIVGKGIVEVTNVERYTGPEATNGYITRSAAEKETGLWVISFKLKDNEGQADAFDNFKKAAVTNVNGQDRQILYAVGIKNTDFTPEVKEEGDNTDYDRYVVSEYDLGLKAEPADHSWDFDVNDEIVAKIHNRYVVNENKPNAGTELWTDDKDAFEDSYFDEFTYIYDYPEVSPCAKVDGDNDPDGRDVQFYDEKGNIIYTYPGYTYSQFIYDPDDNANVMNRYKHETLKKGGYMTNGIDNRHDYAIKVVNFDEDGWANITIKFPEMTCGRHTDIKAFYVTLDQNFARESTTSEVSAWTQYIYDGVGFQSVNGFDTKTGIYKLDTERNDEQAGVEKGIRKATLFVKEDGKPVEGTIRVKDARGAKGDIIGFRVFAVNLDGTLYDPDGRAFYVKLGDAGEEHTLNFIVEAKKKQDDAAIQEKDIEYSADKKDLDIVGYNEAAAEDKNNPFFNMFKKEQNKGGKYYYEWTWAENTAKVRGENNTIWSPLAGTTGYSEYFQEFADADLISELFEFSFTNDNPANVKTGNWETTATTGEIPEGSSILRFLYEGNPEIQNVKVTLKDAARLQDNATYHLILKITLKDAEGAENVVNTINVNVTKKMPETLPDDFAVRVGQEGFAKDVNFFLRAYTGLDTWNITKWFDYTKEDYGKSKIDEDDNFDYTRWAYDSRPYNFEEIFVGLVDENKVFDQNYKFVFPGCGDFTKDKDGIGADAVTTFMMYPYQASPAKWSNEMKYTGLNTDKEEEIMDPGYYLPYVYYGVMEIKDQPIAVKAGYIYRGISFNPENLAQVDYEVPADYFDKDGNFVAEKDAAFKATFKCAIQSDEGLSPKATYGVIAFKNDGTTKDEDHDGSTVAKAIPYGNKFIISLDSVYVTWKSKLAAYTNKTDAYNASYFKTNFTNFTQTTTTPAGGKVYYTDTLQTKKPLEANGKLYKKNGSEANWLRLVGIDAPEVTKVTIYKNDNSTKLVTLEKGDTRINDYFAVTETVDNFGLLFEPKVNSLDPTEIGKFEIEVNTKEGLGFIHQWGHFNSFTGGKKTVIVINPNSTPEV